MTATDRTSLQPTDSVRQGATPLVAAELFAGPGEMRARCRELDWASTPVGAVDTWPSSLVTVVGIVLAAPVPMIVLWGPDAIQIYNDGYSELMGAKHPGGLVQPSRVCWPEVWDFNQPILQGVIERGETFTFTDRRFVLERRGAPAEAFFTLTFSPVPDGRGGIGGTLATVFETTAQVAAQTSREAERDRLLAESEEARTRVMATLESIGDAFYAVDPTFRFTYVNRHAEEFFGRRRETLLGCELWAEFPHTVGSDSHGRHVVAMRARTATHFETRSAMNGRWIDVSLYPDEASGGLACYFRDITERKEAEAALRASESKYRALFDSLDSGFCIIEVLFEGGSAEHPGRPVDYRFLEANPAFIQQTGLADATGRTVRELAPTHETDWFERYGRVATTGEPARFEAPAQALGRYYDVYAFRVGAPDQRRVAVLFNDVSASKSIERERERLFAELHAANVELRRLNEEARAAERRAAFLAEVSAASQSLTDPDLLMAATARMLGEHLGVDRCAYAEVEADEDHFVITGDYTRGDTVSIVGRYTFRSFGAEVLRLMRENSAYIVDDEETDSRVTPDDRPAYHATQIRAAICVPLHKEGRFVAAMAVHQRVPRRWTPEEVDLVVTLVRRCWESLERARAYRSLREREAALQATSAQLVDRTAAAESALQIAEAASRAKSDFLAIMSHELRTPLNAIGGYAELLELGIHGPVSDEQRQALERIQQSQRHLLGLINQVLNYARIDAGVVRYDLVDVTVHEAIVAAESLVLPQMRARGLRYAHDVPDPALVIHADREKLQQVLLNLLTNAIKFTEPGGEVRVSSSARDGFIDLTVSDTGIGIAPEKVSTIFEPFVQVDQRHTRSHEGVGLGLAISRDLARGMGGDLTVDSRPGAGSVFTLIVPRARVA